MTLHVALAGRVHCSALQRPRDGFCTDSSNAAFNQGEREGLLENAPEGACCSGHESCGFINDLVWFRSFRGELSRVKVWCADQASEVHPEFRGKFSESTRASNLSGVAPVSCHSCV